MSLDMITTVNNLMPTENIFFSPLSVYNALILAYFVSAGHTEEALKKTLNLPQNQTKVNTMQAYKLEKHFELVRKTSGSPSYELSTANRLFVSPALEVKACMQELFANEIAVTDFSKDPAAALEEINGWVANQTKNQIKDLLSAGQITQATNLVLTNAAYFKGVWKSRFQPESTRKEVFYISNSEKTFVNMMKQKSTFNHMISEKLGAHILELPYKGDDVSMFFLLPPFVSPSGITNILKRLTIENLKEVVNGLIPRSVDVSIPKFSVEQSLPLKEILETMGVKDLFQSTADLTSLTGVKDVSLDDAIHKAKVIVDEDGTTAAAATALFNFRSSRPLDTAQFICNHPFVYFLFDRTTNTILFMGVFNKPPESV